MGKKLAFRWVSFVGDNEGCVGDYTDSKIIVNQIHTKVRLNQMVEAAKYVEELDGVKMYLDDDYEDNVLIQGLTGPIQLTTSSEIGDYRNTYVTSDNGPSVQWLLDNKEALYTADPSKVLHVGDMAVQFSLYDHNDDTLIVTVLSAEDTDDFVEMVDGDHIE